jgi:hypothetical protein
MQSNIAGEVAVASFTNHNLSFFTNGNNANMYKIASMKTDKSMEINGGLYINKSTNIDYQPLSYYKENKQSIIDEINEFMSQIYPNESVKNYMWEHLASTLIGNNPNPARWVQNRF